MTTLSQQQYLDSIAGINDPNGLRQFLADWANGGAATHQIVGGDNVNNASYEQVLADLANRGIDTSGMAQHVTAAPVAGVGTPDPGYDAYYQNQQRQIGTDRDAQLATNDYSRFLAQQRGQRALGDLATQWDQKRVGLPSNYIQRGVYGSGSGIYAQGLQDYARNRATDENNATDTYNQTLRGYDLTADQIRQRAQQSQSDLDAQRQTQYQNTSSKLAAAQPFTV